MKVLHICPDYFGRHLYHKLFLSLQTEGIICEVFACPNKKISNSTEKSHKIISLNKEFSKFDRFIYFRKQRIIYKTILHEFTLSEFNIVHAHTLFSAGYSAYLLHKKFNLPYIVAIRATDVELFFKSMFHLRGLGRTIMNNAQNIIFLSPSYRDFVINKYVVKKDQNSILDKSIVIPNGIDEYFLDNKFVLKKIINSNYVKLIYVGEITYRKNIDTTIQACKLLIAQGYNVNYTIVGEILDIKYKKIISKYSFIKYHSKCPMEEILLHLKQSDIFVMPSILETFGLVYAEAMSQGLPIIYSKGQGFDGQFENGVVGFAVNCYDYKDIAQKIIYLYNNYAKFSERCISLVDKFNWSTISKEYKRIYCQEIPKTVTGFFTPSEQLSIENNTVVTS